MKVDWTNADELPKTIDIDTVAIHIGPEVGYWSTDTGKFEYPVTPSGHICAFTGRHLPDGWEYFGHIEDLFDIYWIRKK